MPMHRWLLLLFSWTAATACLVNAAGLPSPPEPRLGNVIGTNAAIANTNGKLDPIRQLRVMPNPYPMPGTLYAINFDHAGEPSSRPRDIDDCIAYATEKVVTHIREYGDDLLPYDNVWHGLDILYRGYEFRIRPTSTIYHHRLTYNDTTHVLSALALKMRLDGYCDRHGPIMEIGTGRVVGTAYLDADDEEEELHTDALQIRSVLPNPYPLPNTPYSIEFEEPEDPMPILPADEVKTCIGYFLDRIVRHIGRHGDGLIPYVGGQGIWGLDWPLRKCKFRVDHTPVVDEQCLTYNASAAVLGAFSTKMRLEGYTNRWADIIITATGESVGDAYLGEEPVVRVGNKTLRLDPIPNPYPLPHSDLEVDFEEEISPLSKANTRDCISWAREQIVEHIKQHGEGPVPSTQRPYRWRTVEFRILPEPTQRRVTYNDTLDILSAYAIRFGRDGARRDSYFSRWAEVKVQGTQQIIATALIGQAVGVGAPSPQPNETATTTTIRLDGPLTSPFY